MSWRIESTTKIKITFLKSLLFDVKNEGTNKCCYSFKKNRISKTMGRGRFTLILNKYIEN